MAWNNEPEHKLIPKERAKQVIEDFFPHAYHPNPIFNTSDDGGHTNKCAIIFQKGIIKKLESYGIHSDYEYEVLNQIKKI